MGTSTFIISVPKREIMRTQFKRFRAQVAPPMAKGPLSDGRGEIRKLALYARKRLPRDEALVSGAVVNALLGCKEIPFRVVEENRINPFSIRTADAIASESVYGQRMITTNDIVTLTVSILRQLGFDSYVSYIHDHVPTPAIARFGSAPEPQLLAFANMIKTTSPTEFLDDEALHSLLHFDTAKRMLCSMLGDCISGKLEFSLEGRIRAAAIGHMIYRALRLWDLENVSESYKSIMGIPCKHDGELRSIRHFGEALTRFVMFDPPQMRMAAQEILCPVARGGIWDGTPLDKRKRHSFLEELDELSEVHGCGCAQAATAYLQLVDTISYHLHGVGECGLHQELQ